MKRLNPQTNKPFKRGDIREDGRVFYGYKTNKIKKDGFFIEDWITKNSLNKHIAKTKKYQKIWYENNKEHVKQKSKNWDKENLIRKREIKQNWKKNNRDIENAHSAKRRASKLQRTPKWLTEDDLWMIEQAYEIAQLRTKMTGFQWHIDHILPLQGKLVSGLHVPNNLQVIPGSENVKKSNKYVI